MADQGILNRDPNLKNNNYQEDLNLLSPSKNPVSSPNATAKTGHDSRDSILCAKKAATVSDPRLPLSEKIFDHSVPKVPNQSTERLSFKKIIDQSSILSMFLGPFLKQNIHKVTEVQKDDSVEQAKSQKGSFSRKGESKTSPAFTSTKEVEVTRVEENEVVEPRTKPEEPSENELQELAKPLNIKKYKTTDQLMEEVSKEIDRVLKDSHDEMSETELAQLDILIRTLSVLFFHSSGKIAHGDLLKAREEAEVYAIKSADSQKSWWVTSFKIGGSVITAIAGIVGGGAAIQGLYTGAADIPKILGALVSGGDGVGRGVSGVAGVFEGHEAGNRIIYQSTQRREEETQGSERNKQRQNDDLSRQTSISIKDANQQKANAVEALLRER